MISTKNKKNTPQLTRRAALTTPPGVFRAMRNRVCGFGSGGHFREGW
jgi:hypothetical protein